MRINRRDAVKAFLSGVAASSLAPIGTAQAANILQGNRSIALDNGFRLHCMPNNSGYVAATLVLRSKEISNNGLAHLCEHTSFSGAAGTMSAAEVAGMYKSCIQESNASTEVGAIQWHASFLPQYLPQATSLAVTALDQKFDLATVGAQARVVLEEALSRQIQPRQTRGVQNGSRAARPIPSIRQGHDGRGSCAMQSPTGRACSTAARLRRLRSPAGEHGPLFGGLNRP